MIYGPIYVSDLENDLDQVEQILRKDHSQRWKPDLAAIYYAKTAPRTILDSRRSLGSVIKLLTPSSDYTDEYNAWLRSIPSRSSPWSSWSSVSTSPSGARTGASTSPSTSSTASPATN